LATSGLTALAAASWAPRRRRGNGKPSRLTTIIVAKHDLDRSHGSTGPHRTQPYFQTHRIRHGLLIEAGHHLGMNGQAHPVPEQILLDANRPNTFRAKPGFDRGGIGRPVAFGRNFDQMLHHQAHHHGPDQADHEDG